MDSANRAKKESRGIVENDKDKPIGKETNFVRDWFLFVETIDKVRGKR